MNSSIYFFIVNMTKNPDRYHNISKMLDDINVSYSRIEAIDGFHMENNIDCLNILKCRVELLNTYFKCITFKQEWKYDGSIKSSFPGLNINGHEGAKGLILSNIKSFIRAQELQYEWYCILEDDAEINTNIYNEIQQFINNPENKNMDIIFLDKRRAGGSSGNLFNNKIIDKLITDLNPLSDFSISMEEKYDLAPLWDWKLWCYAQHYNIKYGFLSCISSGQFPSTITV